MISDPSRKPAAETIIVKRPGCNSVNLYDPKTSVIADRPAFSPSTIRSVAPNTPIICVGALSRIRPLIAIGPVAGELLGATVEVGINSEFTFRSPHAVAVTRLNATNKARPM
jgi:hypothetical protein